MRFADDDCPKRNANRQSCMIGDCPVFTIVIGAPLIGYFVGSSATFAFPGGFFGESAGIAFAIRYLAVAWIAPQI